MSAPTALVSVIIPVFNGEKHLRECLDSVSRQSYRHLEIIVVDDGSTDGTARILRDRGQRDPRIISVHCRNAGVSSARNVGLDVAHGEWIMFVDADDMMSSRLVVEAVVLAGDEEVDLLCFESSSREPASADDEDIAAAVSPTGARESMSSSRAERIVACAHDFTFDRTTLATMITDESLNALWDKAYRHETILQRRCRFQEGTRMGEDLLFNLSYVGVDTTVRSIPILGYFYRRDDPGSATTRYLPGKFSDLMAVSDHLSGWAREVGAAELQGAADYVRAKNVVSCIRDLHHRDCPLSRKDRLAAARAYKSQVPTIRAHGIGAGRRMLCEFYNMLGPRSVYHLTRLLTLLR